MDEDDSKEILDQLKVSSRLDGEGIVSALNSMAEEGWWDDLEERADNGSGNASEGDFHDAYEEVVRSEMRMCAREVKPDGWVFDKNPMDRPFFDYQPVDPGVFLRLPAEVAAMGVVGMQLSCMSLALRRGVWRPVGMYDDAIVVANVYPP